MRILSFLCIFGISLIPAFGGFRVPKGVFHGEQLKEAAKQAKQEGKALALVYTDSGST